MSIRILFVCLGNICRSPAAEGVVRSLAPHLVTDSAGTGGWHVGEAPYAPMQTAARARGYDISDLRARQFSPMDFTLFDLIVAMDSAILRDLEAQRPPQEAAPVRLLTDYAPELGVADIPDPYFTQDFSGVLDLIERCAQGLVKQV